LIPTVAGMVLGKYASCLLSSHPAA
jgi:hypothetical protein